MKWVDYPTRRDFDHRENGIIREGAYWSPAPGPGYKWLVPTDGIGKREPVRVRFARVGDLPNGVPGYRIVNECWEVAA